MLKKAAFVVINLFVLSVLYSFEISAYSFKKSKQQQQNHAPVVKIIAPKNNSVFAWNTPVQYKIKVSDQEDGESAFDEIPSNEVFLEVRYLADGSKASAELNKAVKNDPAGLAAIKTSNCLNCHAFTGKFIGPSFYDISKRYPYSKAAVQLLSKHIREGSTGIWGTVAMPTHAEISKVETEEMVQWILKKGSETGITYYKGTEGFFTIKPGVGSRQKGVFVVTASYADHGLKDQPKQNLRGQDVIIIQGK